MARSVPLSTLRTRVRQRADIENATARFSDAEVTDNINEGIAELYDVVRGVFGQDYYRSASTFTTAANTASYNLPADFVSLISVDVTMGPNVILSARPYMENERNRFKFFPVGWIFNEPIFYRLTAGTITFIPTPSGAYSVTLNYVPTSPTLVNPADTVDGIAGWEEFVVAEAAIRCLLKDEEMALIPMLQARKAEVRARIESLAPERDAGAPERVHDVYGRDEYGWGYQ